jgi:hypothetical protein
MKVSRSFFEDTYLTVIDDIIFLYCFFVRGQIYLIFLFLTAPYNCFFVACRGGGKQIHASTVFELQSFFKFLGGARKVAHGYVCLGYAVGKFFQFLFAERAEAVNLEYSSRKILGERVACVKLTVVVQLRNAESGGERAVKSGFQNG